MESLNNSEEGCLISQETLPLSQKYRNINKFEYINFCSG